MIDLDGKRINIDLGADDVLEQVAEIREYLDGIPDHKNVLITIGEAGDTGDAANAINDLTDALNRNAEAWSRVEDVGRDYSVMMGETIADANATTGALERVFSVSEGGVAEQLSVAEATGRVVDAMHEEAQATVDLHSGLAYTAADMALLGAALGSTVTDAAGATRAIGGVGSAVADAGTIVASQGGAIANFFSTWGTTIHWVVAGGSEILAVTIPARWRWGPGRSPPPRAPPGWRQDGRRLHRHRGHLVDAEHHGRGGARAGRALQQAQTAADPGVYEMFGAGLNIAREASAVSFARAWTSSTSWTSSPPLDLGPGGGPLARLTSCSGNGVTDLTELGQILGNLGHFINFASEMPGLAEVLLGLIDDFTGLLSVIAGGFHGELSPSPWAWRRRGGGAACCPTSWVTGLPAGSGHPGVRRVPAKMQMGGQTVEEFNAAIRVHGGSRRAAGEYALYAAGTEEAAAATAGLTETRPARREHAGQHGSHAGHRRSAKLGAASMRNWRHPRAARRRRPQPLPGPWKGRGRS